MKAFIFILHKKKHYSCEKTHFKGISDEAAIKRSHEVFPQCICM